MYSGNSLSQGRLEFDNYLLISGLEKLGNVMSWDQKIDHVIRVICYIQALYNKVPL